MLVAALLLAACTTAAVYLYDEQATTADFLRENVSSRRIAQELETSFGDLLTLLRSGSDQLDALDERIQGLITDARSFADKDEEARLVERLETSFTTYREVRRGNTSVRSVPTEDQTKTAIQILDTEALPVCRELGLFNTRQTEQSEDVHYQRVKWMAWGLASVGGIGALAGVFLGYGMARGLRHSIYQLSVRIRDAADRLGQELPTVTVVQDGDFSLLQGQMERLVREIETVVKQLQQREREVLRAEQMGAVGQLATGAAHELRNPLTAIKMLLQNILEEAAERDLPVEDLGIMEGEVRRMERCLHTFLDFARPPKPECRPFDLATVVDKAFPLLESRARHAGVAMHVAPPDHPMVVAADPEQIQQVLVNLVLNAIDATPRGGRLDVELCHSTDGSATLRVRDTGPGIPPELLPRLFEPFVSSKETGLGLGLVVSRRIAEAHGGSLRASNRVQGGACFELRLPVARAVASVAVSTP